jgi:hypothetical protein
MRRSLASCPNCRRLSSWLYCFFVLEHGRRRILHLNVTPYEIAGASGASWPRLDTQAWRWCGISEMSRCSGQVRSWVRL